MAVPLSTVARLSAVNLGGSFVVAREAARLMIARRAVGTIVSVASGAALAALPGRAAYGMTKAAIIGLTRALAREWEPFGVRVNAVLPGYVETEILQSLRREGRFDPATVTRAIALGRLAAPHEIAEVVRQIAGTPSVTGGAYLVDGGVDAFGGSGAAATIPAPAPPLGGCAVVVGGAGAVGAALADRWVAEGRRTIVLDRDPPAIIRDRITIAVDLDDGDAVASAVREAASRFGPIGIFAHVIGADRPAAPSLDQRRADFDRLVAAKLMGALAVAQAVAPGMIERGGGTIVHLLPAAQADGAVVAGLALLTKGVACEWAVHGIRANAVLYGDDAGDHAAAAGLAVFLASDRASYVTGAIWPGATTLGHRPAADPAASAASHQV